MPASKTHNKNHAELSPELWRQFNHTTVRDLAWVLFSPDLLCDELNGYARFKFELDSQLTLDWLNKLDKDVNADKAFATLNSGNDFRLGYYVEDLLAYLFTAGYAAEVIPYQLLARNVQIIEDKHTLGELDFILRHKSGALLHLEAAVKFYLGHSDKTNQTFWIGPNAKDRFDLKLNRTLNHQLPMANTAQARKILVGMQIDPSTLHSAYLFRGMLFQPWGNNALPLPEEAHPYCLQGSWLALSNLQKLDSFSSIRWQALEKLEWLTGKLNNHTPAEDNSKLLREYAKKRDLKTSLLALVDTEPGSRLNRQHLMIVDDHWPETNSPSRKI